MPEEIKQKLIEEEMKEAYIDYSMSVIVGRALPDVRDGLKPVHRRILYSMHDMGLASNKPFVKSARIVGECFKYHPHGDVALYESLVRMAQNFSLMYPLISGHGNFGSIDFQNPAQMRYTEAKLSKIAEEMLVDIEKETVNFTPNFDGSLKEPVVLPSKIPNLLVNGSSGIAVGMATNIPPHNIIEIINGIIMQIDNPDVSLNELLTVIKGPDFPTAGTISGTSGIIESYKTGRGLIRLRAKANFEEKGNKKRIIITEIPYQVNKSVLITGIADLVRDKKIEGISDIRDESNREGIRVVIELKRDVSEDLILNQLYKHSQLETTFGIIMIALVENQPKLLSLKDIITHYILHRKEVVTRRTQFDLRKAEERVHILEGLLIALADIDNIVKLIKASNDVIIARNNLISNYKLSEIQANSILDMKLQKLTSLESNKIKEEHTSLLELIKELKEILASEKRILEIIKVELIELKKYGKERKTQIMDSQETGVEELIKDEEVVITLTNQGYIKRISIDNYKQQKRGGKGIIGAETKEDDYIEHLFTTSTHNHLLLFTNLGKVHWLKAYDIPEAGRYSKGKAIINIVRVEKDEKITAIIPVKEFSKELYLVAITKKGLIKKTSLQEYSNPRKGGIIAINLKDDDKLVNVKITNGKELLIIATQKGMAVKFNEEDVRPVGRNASGVRGIKLEEDEVVGMEIAKEEDTLLTVTENGFGKRSLISDYRLISRGGKGVINIKDIERNGNVVGIKVVNNYDELIFVSRKGMISRISLKDISIIGRNTSGVRIMKLDEGDKLINLAKVVEDCISLKPKGI